MIGSRRAQILLAGLGLSVVVAVTPTVTGRGYWFALFTFPGVVCLTAAVLRLDAEFGVSLLGRRVDPNYWTGAAGGLVGGVTALGTTYGVMSDTVDPTVLPSIWLFCTVYLLLFTVLLFGSVLRDVEQGYLSPGSG